MKKSMLFTVLVLLILGTILSTTTYFARRAEHASLMHGQLQGVHKLVKYNADIAIDYFDILNIEIEELSILNETTRLNLSLDLSPQKADPAILMNQYVSYLESVYNLRSNINASLEISPIFEISDAACLVNATFMECSLGEIEELSIRADAGALIINAQEVEQTSSSGGTELSFLLHDSNDNEIFSSYQNINISDENIYSIEFNHTTPHTFFRLNISDNLLRVYTEGELNASVNLFFRFNTTENKMYLNSGPNSALQGYFGSINKDGPVELMNG